MSKATKICKVCGKPYEYCKTWNSDNRFRWQDVACSHECGMKYFKQIEESRAKKTDTKVAASKPAKKNTKKTDSTPITKE